MRDLATPCAAAERARDWLAANALILDTETTGLGEEAEVVELAVIDCTGAVLLDTLVRPSGPIPAEARAINGITDAMLADAPAWPEIHDRFHWLIAGRQAVIYNSAFDARVIEQTARRYARDLHAIEPVPLDQVATLHCAMQAYAEFRGEWDAEKERFRWQKLTTAAEQQGISAANAHRALGDCMITLGVIRAMAAKAI